jgi:RNase P protein component
LIREAFRATRALWPAGIDVVVIVKRSPGKTKLESVVSEWEAARPQIERKIRAALARAAEKPETEA